MMKGILKVIVMQDVWIWKFRKVLQNKDLKFRELNDFTIDKLEINEENVMIKIMMIFINKYFNLYNN